eukprot:862997-Pelagomonas_calceolata.AAC.3
MGRKADCKLLAKPLGCWESEANYGANETAEEVDDLVVGDAEVSRRPLSGMSNPDFRGGGHPYISDEGHNIIDIAYDPDIRLFGEAVPYSQVLENICGIPGVVLTGLLQGLAQAALVVKPEGPECQGLPVSRRKRGTLPAFSQSRYEVLLLPVAIRVNNTYIGSGRPSESRKQKKGSFNLGKTLANLLVREPFLNARWTWLA